MFSAVVYSSRTGSCEKYARLISEALGIPMFELSEHKKVSNVKIVYVGWLFAGRIVGVSKAKQRLNLGAAVQVGMGAVNRETEMESRRINKIAASIPLFCLQGAYNDARLPAAMRLLMKPVRKRITAMLTAKTELNAQEQAMLKMASEGLGEPHAWDVSDVVEWCRAH